MCKEELTSARTNLSNIPPEVQRIRRLQIRSVVLGVGGGLLFLTALAFHRIALAWAGLVVFLGALVAVLVLGFASARAGRRLSGG